MVLREEEIIFREKRITEKLPISHNDGKKMQGIFTIIQEEIKSF